MHKIIYKLFVLQEANFNPFYSQVAIKLSSLDRRYKVINGFCVHAS